MQNIRQINQKANRNLGKLFFIGLAGVLVYNARQWRRDKALAQRLREMQTPLPQLARTPKVSALVAAWNEADNIDAHIQSFLALGYPEIELVFCAGGEDDTLARAQSYAGERVIVLEQQRGEGKQKSLARCLEHASGEIVYLTDADCLFDDEALVRLLAPIVNEGEQVVTGRSRPLARQVDKLLPAYLSAAEAVASARNPRSIQGLLGRNAIVTRAAVDQSGGLDFPARTGTDYQLARRLIGAGLKIRYIGESVVQTVYPETIGDYRRRQSRWLRNLLIHGQRYGMRADVRVTMQTIGTGVAMLAAPISSFWLGTLALVPWIILVAHAASSKLRYTLFAARLYESHVPARLVLALVPLTLIDFAVWASPLFDLIHPSRREQW